ncbi:hypothetical protein AB0D57_08025 [Streptomyces sp. NPDC048275]|uniref:hypothetical protein n=1 Tax=Streptomyces sp. NPDC048275 TaxID=3155629 RepID=UPI0033D378E2
MKVLVELDTGETQEPGASDTTDHRAPDPPSASSTRLTELTGWWAEQVLEPYLAKKNAQRYESDSYTVELLGEPVQFTVRFGAETLEDLLAAYAAFGWDALEVVEARMDQQPKNLSAMREFFAGTRDTIAVMVAYGLILVEGIAIGRPRASWEKGAEELAGYRDEFLDAGVAVTRPEFKDQKKGDRVVVLCRQYALAADEASRLGQQVADWQSKTPYQHRGERGSGWDQWVELYAAPQRVQLEKMSCLLTEVIKEFPAAALFLDSLPGEFRKAYAPWKARPALAKAVAFGLNGMIADLRTLLASLGAPAGTDRLARLDQPRVPPLELQQGGFEQEICLYVLGRGEKEQRVLANPYLLSELTEDKEHFPEGSWEQIVLTRYLHTLSLEIERREKSDEAWRTFWGWVGRIAAVLALIKLMAVFPFGTAAAGSALAAVLAFAGHTAAVLSIVVLLVDGIYGTLVAMGKADKDARDQLFRLAQEDPEAFRDISRLLGRSHAIRRMFAEGLATMLVRMGLARVRIIAFALELDDFLDDVRTAFAPLDTVSG